MRKKVLALVLALVMVIAMLPTVAFAADFADTKGHWAETQIDRWSDFGVVGGDGTGFNPNGSMTRAQAAQVFVNLLKLTKAGDIAAYTDVPATAWYADAISKVVEKGIMNGVSATTMNPEGTLTREQMFVMIGRALGVKPVENATKTFVDGKETSDWATGYINALADMGVIHGTGNNELNPTDVINRASVMTVLDNLIGGYANEEGQTVEIVEGKITLIVADDVKVTGEADPDVPIVVAGAAKTVDLEGVTVTGEEAPVVQVQVEEVAIENAPEGTTVAAPAEATDVKVNGETVEAGSTTTAPAPEPEQTAPSQQGTTPAPVPQPAPTPTESVTVADIDAIIEQGRQDVNKEMHGDDNIDYAVIPEFEKTGDPREVTVTVYDSTATVGDIYNDIIGTLVSALQQNASKVSTITAVTDITNKTVTTETDADNYKKTLTLGSSISNNDVILFVKALVGQDYHRVTDISGLIGKNFVVEVADVESGSFATTVQYKVTFEMASLDDVIAEKIPEISKTMSSYATAEWDGTNHTLNVVITDNNTELGTVYQNIGDTLVDAFNLVRKQLTQVKDANGSKELTITDKIDGDKLVDFVKGLKIKDSSSSSSQDLTQLLSSGQAKVILLLGHEFNISVTGKGTPTGASGTATYTIKFISKLDSEIAREIPNISQKMSAYATAEWKGDTHTLDVTITDGETPVGTVYDDIADMLCTAFNKARTTLSTVKDALQGGTSELQDLQTKDLDNDTLKAFVKDLKISTKNSEVKTVMEVLQQNEGLKIKGLDGCKFEINVTGNGQDTPVKYTISFTVTPAER